MNFTAAIDISTFIWCKDDYGTNKHLYYKLIELAPTIYEQVKENRVSVLLRPELYEIFMAEFPYTEINEINHDFEVSTLTFLIDANWYEYEDCTALEITTTPDILKKHFSEDVKKEAKHQIGHLFEIQDIEYKYLTYYSFYKHDENLLLKNEDIQIEIDTLFYSSEEEIKKFFEKFKIKFKHNPKHDIFNAGGKISPLSCYDKRKENEAQKLLETGFFFEDDFYNYDEDSDVYVKFVSSNDGTYHGYDLSNEGDNVPKEVKNKFNKDGRKF